MWPTLDAFGGLVIGRNTLRPSASARVSPLLLSYSLLFNSEPVLTLDRGPVDSGLLNPER